MLPPSELMKREGTRESKSWPTPWPNQTRRRLRKDQVLLSVIAMLRDLTLRLSMPEK